LSGRNWLTGAGSIGDPYLFVVLRWARAKGMDLQGLDNLAALGKRLYQDTGVQAEGI